MRNAPNSGANLPEPLDPYNIRHDVVSAVLSLDAWVGRLLSFVQTNGGIRGAGIESISQTSPDTFTVTWFDPDTSTRETQDIVMPISAGNVVVIDWDGQGSTPPRAFPPGHPLAGQPLPAPPHVIVQWRSSVPPTVTPMEGDEWFRVSDQVVY